MDTQTWEDNVRGLGRNSHKIGAKSKFKENCTNNGINRLVEEC